MSKFFRQFLETTTVLGIACIISITNVTAVTSTPRPTNTPKPTLTPRPTNTPRPTVTPRLTSTPRPTSTPKPTNTPKPSPTPKPPASIDLQIFPENLKYTGLNLKGGDKSTLKATVSNKGNSAAKNFIVRFYADETQIYEKTINNISKNGKSTVTYQYQIPDNATAGFSFIAIIDPDSALTETNKDNNTASLTVPVTASQKNLIIESFTPSKTKPKPGESLSWKIKVKNVGNAKATNIKIS